MPDPKSRRLSRRRRRTFKVGGPEQLETRQLLTAEISGTVFYDSNEDGTHDESEQGVPGVLVTLSGTVDETGDAITRRYLTQEDGSYIFDNLEAGTYEVVESQPAALADGLDQTTAEGPVTGDDSYSDIVVEEDTEVTGLNFGEGTIDAQFISPIWLLASSGSEEFRREMRASQEEDAGNTEFAEAIRDGETELDTDFDLNAPPTASGENYTVGAGETLTVSTANGVLANDSDPTDDELTAVLVEQASNGSVALSDDGSFNYTPDVGFVGSDSFTYEASDGFQQSNPVTVSIEVGNPNTFTVSAAAAIEGDLIGTVETLTDLGDDVVFEIADPTLDERFSLAPDDHTSGNADASVVVIEYLDFACPACRAFHESSTAQLLALSPGDYLSVYRYLPLETLESVFNIEAAQAAEAAGRQGLFIEMMDQLFDNQDEWRAAADAGAAIELFEQYGAEIAGFDLGQFRSDFSDPDVLDRINRDADVARDLGLAATPTFIVDGEITSSANLTPQTLEAALVDAQQDPVRINRFSNDSATAGDLLVANSSAISTDDSPLSIDIIARSGSTSETIRVDLEILE